MRSIKFALYALSLVSLSYAYSNNIESEISANLPNQLNPSQPAPQPTPSQPKNTINPTQPKEMPAPPQPKNSLKPSQPKEMPTPPQPKVTPTPQQPQQPEDFQ